MNLKPGAEKFKHRMKVKMTIECIIKVALLKSKIIRCPEKCPWEKKSPGKNPPRKLPPGNMPPGRLLPGNWPPVIVPF